MDANNQAQNDDTRVLEESNEQQAQNDQQEADDLSAGFAKVHAQAPANGKPVAGEATATAPAANNQASTEAPAAPSSTTRPAVGTADKPVLFAGMTEAEIRDALGRASAVEARMDQKVQQAFGKLGEYKRTLDEFGQKLASNAGGSRGARKIKAEMLKRVSEELPGLGDALAADLDAIFGSDEAVQAGVDDAQAQAKARGEAFDPEDYFAQKLSPALMAMEERLKGSYEERLVKWIHPDFNQVCSSRDFQTFLQTLTPARYKQVVESEDATVAGSLVTDFKTWDKAQKAKRSRNTQRLESAIGPEGTGAALEQSTNSEDDDLSAGYQKVAKKRLA